MDIPCGRCKGTGDDPYQAGPCIQCDGDGLWDMSPNAPHAKYAALDIRDRVIAIETVLADLTDKVNDVATKCDTIKEKVDEIKAVVDLL